MSAPAVSVLVPAHDSAPWLGEALGSLAAQSFGDFEAVVSDDASTDASREVAAVFAARDARFRLVGNAVNAGMTANWNLALREARGRYVAKLDADDAFAPDALRVMVAEMEGPARPRAVFCRTVVCDAALRPTASYPGDAALERAGLDPRRLHRRGGHAWYALCFDDVQLWHSNAQLHRREQLLGRGGWDEDWGCASDTDLLLRVLESGEPVTHLPYEGVRYRVRSGSVSDEYRRRRWLLWEGCLIHLFSLSRHAAGGGRVTGPLRRAWYRYWRNWLEVRGRGEGELEGMPPAQRARLLARSRLVQPPPLAVRGGEGARLLAWRLKRAVLPAARGGGG